MQNSENAAAYLVTIFLLFVLRFFSKNNYCCKRRRIHILLATAECGGETMPKTCLGIETKGRLQQSLGATLFNRLCP
jgi:hypothetical protein